MLDKLIKGLSGLGGAAALTTGGVFLKNHIVRVNHLKAYNTKIEKLELELRNGNGDESGTYFLRSSDPDVFWEWMWILEVEGGSTGTKEYTKEFMKKREESHWNGSTFSGKEEGKKINEEYPNHEYWQKYREFCFLWVDERRTKEDFGVSSPCQGDYPWSKYKDKKEYKEYLKLDGKISFRGFLWTIWRKFQKEKSTDLAGQKTDTEVLQLFEQWKGANPSLFPQ